MNENPRKIPEIFFNSFKLAFALNALLFLIMVVILSMNFAQIPKLNGEGPIVIFIIDIISNAIWLISTVFMVSAYTKYFLKANIIHVILMVILWGLKLTELILSVVLIKSPQDENVLTFGNKTSTVAGVAVDVGIIIPLTVLGVLSAKYLHQFHKNARK